MQTPSKLRLCWMMKFIGAIRRCQAVKTFINKNGQLEVYPPRDRQPVYVGVGVAWWDRTLMTRRQVNQYHVSQFCLMCDFCFIFFCFHVFVCYCDFQYICVTPSLTVLHVCTRDVGLETWSWSRDWSRPLFWGLGLRLGLDLLVLVLVLVSEGGLEQDLRLCATATLLASKVETSKWMCSIIYLFIGFSAFSSF